jgi:5-methylcytosine-specific restriction endonuclease McrA
MDPDKRHTLTHRKRAEAAGVDHVPYSRAAILARWCWLCAYCDARARHLDHVIPLKLGGADAEHNIVPACQNCNLRKGALSLADWALKD